MKTLAAYTLTALMAFATAVPVTQVAAQDLEIDRNGPKVRLRDDDRCDPRFERCRGERWDDRRRPRFCTEDRALSKAERMGLRRAQIVEANRRVIVVRARDRFGERVRIAFGRDRSCPVLN